MSDGVYLGVVKALAARGTYLTLDTGVSAIGLYLGHPFIGGVIALLVYCLSRNLCTAELAGLYSPIANAAFG